MTLYQVITFAERASFLFDYVLINAGVLSALSALWFSISSRLRINPGVVAYFFIALVDGGLCAIVAGKYQVLKYFSDAMDYRLATQLAGGSLADAISYLTDEMVVVCLVAVLAFAAIGGGYLLLRRRLAAVCSAPQGTGMAGWLAVGALSLAIAVLISVSVQRDPKIAYGLARTLAYPTLIQATSRAWDLRTPRLDVAQFRRIPPIVHQAPDPHVRAECPPNLFVFVLESARQDILGKTISGKPVTPVLNEIAARYTSVGQAYSHAGFTVPSLKSLFTGAQPDLRNPDQSLFAVLKRSGYQVAIISGQGEDLGNIAGSTGMREYSDSFFDGSIAPADRVQPSKEPASMHLPEWRLLKELDRVLASFNPARPMFIYFNTQAGHFPYYHPGMEHILTDNPLSRSQISPSRRDELFLTYYNAIAVADRLVGDAIARLQRGGVYDGALMIALGDHGESLFDDNFLGHGHVLNDTQTRIPLVINRADLKLSSPIGEDELMTLVLRLLNGLPPQDLGHSKAVLQYIGSLDAPAQLGMVEDGGRRTIINFDASRLFFSDLGQWKSPEEVQRDEALRARAAKLVALWDGARQ